MPFNPEQIDLFPLDPGVYLMKNKEGKVIYVGKAKILRQRVKQYFSEGRDARAMIPFLVAEIEQIETIVVRSEKEALLLENTLIKKHQPKYNAVLKDDKSYISLFIDPKQQWPMLKLVRYKGQAKGQGLYFGPYTSAFAARRVYDLLVRLFPMRQCSDEELKRRSRPCLLYDMKRCVAPCMNLCTHKEYEVHVQGAIRFLRGQDKEITRQLRQEMEKASDALEFEKAGFILKTIEQIEHVVGDHQLVFKASGKDTDALAIYRQGAEVMVMQLLFRSGKLTGSEYFSFSDVMQEDAEILSSFILQNYKGKSPLPEEILVSASLEGAALLEDVLSETSTHKMKILYPLKGEKLEQVKLASQNAKSTFIQHQDRKAIQEKMLLDLQDQLGLIRYPRRIECFDTSNTAGTDLIACMISFLDGERDKKQTRYFHIKGIDKSDDYGAMRQALHRRLSKTKEGDDLPDLIIVDGGKGQLNVALSVLKELEITNVDVIGLAKEGARHDKGLSLEKIFLQGQDDPLILPYRSQLLFFLQTVRDTAHDTAVRFHRKSRSKRTIKSALDEIPGIGPTKRKKLLSQFGSLIKIKEASDADLKAVSGINKKDIQAIREFLNKRK